MDFVPPVPDLAAQGFELQGVRLDRVGPYDAAVVRWRIRNHMIDLFVWRSASSAAEPAQTERWGGFGVVRWQANALRLTAISDVDLKDLERFAAEMQAR